MLQSRFRFIKVRNVKNPTRGNPLDAGIDFYVPTDLTIGEMTRINSDMKGITVQYLSNTIDSGLIDFDINKDGKITKIWLNPQARVIIPSGIKVLLEPAASMLQVNNKSGVSTKKGLIYTAQVVDSTYTGEIHICVLNTTSGVISIDTGTKLVQLVHIPIFPTRPEEITQEEFSSLSKTWSTRGEKWQGSTDNI